MDSDSLTKLIAAISGLVAAIGVLVNIIQNSRQASKASEERKAATEAIVTKVEDVTKQ